MLLHFNIKTAAKKTYMNITEHQVNIIFMFLIFNGILNVSTYTGGFINNTLVVVRSYLCLNISPVIM